MDWHYKNGEKGAKLDADEYFYKDFHTVGYMWYKDKAVFTLDGEEFFSYTYGDKDEFEDDLDSFDEPLSMKITMAVGFQDYPVKGASYWQDSNKFIVDYVHVYQDKTGFVKIY
jgi:beta-glucanase (GH16 family)